ncbi:MAG: VWA domain-containing protein [Chloroflexi bacterium]|nr:VWA domain-containing protein [Chloroflexota bacterium]
MYAYRYARWDGTQRVFDLDEERLMEELSGDLLAHGDVWRALRHLLQRGVRGEKGDGIEGLRQLLDRLRNRRQDYLGRYQLDSLLEDIKERLGNVVRTEREGMDRRLQEAREQAARGSPVTPAEAGKLLELLEERARRNREQLDKLSQSVGGAIKELRGYEFMDPEAQRQFQELLDLLQRQMLQNYGQELKQRLQGMTPQDMAALRQMLRDLNRMLRDQRLGRAPDFQGFMQKYGTLFGDHPPKDLQEFLDRLAHQIAQMQSLLESMSPEMRRELEQLLDALLDQETLQELGELAQNLEELSLLAGLRREYPFLGEDPLTLEQAMEAVGTLQGLDELEAKLQEVMRQGSLEELDLDQVERLLGEEARRALENLKRIAQRLEEAGFIQKKGDKLELTPRGIRKLGQKALREVFSRLKRDRLGYHEVQLRGTGGEDSGETKHYEFGDPFDLHLHRTVMNAVSRHGAGVPVAMTPADFEVRRREHLGQAATCLLLDQSRSMGMFGSFLAAKKVALALSSLIRTRFSRDKFYVIGFSDYAVELQEEDLPEVTWNAWVSGTNMHHAFMLSRKLLAREKAGTRQIIVITDGEPTAHLEGTRAFFAYPPSYRTVQETLKEVRRCTQEGIIINTFMLETSSYLLDFVDKMTRINRGRAFYTTPDRLGEFVLVDYLANRRKRLV